MVQGGERQKDKKRYAPCNLFMYKNTLVARVGGAWDCIESAL